MVVRPSMHEEDFTRVRQLRLHRLMQLKDVPGAVADRTFMRLLYGTGVALGPPAMAAMVDATGRYDLPLALVGMVLLFHHAAFVALAQSLGVETVGLLRLYPIGRAKAHWGELALTLPEQTAVLDSLRMPAGMRLMQS